MPLCVKDALEIKSCFNNVKPFLVWRKIPATREVSTYELKVMHDSSCSKYDVPTYTSDDLLKLLKRYEITCNDGHVVIRCIPDNWDRVLPYPKGEGSTLLEALYNLIHILKLKNLL